VANKYTTFQQLEKKPHHRRVLEMRVRQGHRNGDITTHYSAPELEELLAAANKVCEEKSGKSPALVMLKQKTVSA
jgi:hypothetical protein